MVLGEGGGGTAVKALTEKSPLEIILKTYLVNEALGGVVSPRAVISVKTALEGTIRLRTG